MDKTAKLVTQILGERILRRLSHVNCDADIYTYHDKHWLTVALLGSWMEIPGFRRRPGRLQTSWKAQRKIYKDWSSPVKRQQPLTDKNGVGVWPNTHPHGYAS